MKSNKETPEQKRERFKQQELKSNPIGNMNDAFNRATSGVQTDLMGSLGWKATGILIIVMILGFILATIFFT